MAKRRTTLILASAALVVLATAALASAARSSFFSGKTADKVKLTFNASHTSVGHLKTTLTVMCNGDYPQHITKIKLLPISPPGSAKIRARHFTFTVPTPSKTQFTIVTGTIHGRTASGTIKTYYEDEELTDDLQIEIVGCAGKTAWSAKTK